VSRGDPVHGILVVRYLQAVSGQLLTKSYRSGTGGRRRRFQCSHPFGELLGAADQRLPDALAGRRVEGSEDLAAEAVKDHQPLPRRSRRGDPARERVEGADAGRRQAAGGSEAAGGGDPDPQPGEGTGAEADRDQVDLRPAAGGGCCPLDLAQQRGRVPGPAGCREPELRLVQGLAVTPGAGGGVDRRGVEADDGQRACAPLASS
jgi:hypothetical protein